MKIDIGKIAKDLLDIEGVKRVFYPSDPRFPYKKVGRGVHVTKNKETGLIERRSVKIPLFVEVIVDKKNEHLEKKIAECIGKKIPYKIAETNT